MRHLLFIQPALDAVGGIEKVVPVVANMFAQNGAEVSALVFYGQIPNSQTFWSGRYEESESIKKGLINKVVKVWRRARRVLKVLKSNGISVIIVSAQGAIVIVLMLRLLRLIRVPVVVYVHEARGDGGLFYRLLTGLFYPLADGLIGVSEGICRELRNIPLVDSDKVVRAYNSLSTLESKPELEEVARRSLEKFERPLFISAGRFERTKGTDILVESFIAYAKNNPGTLVLLGSGSLESAMKELVRESGQGNRVQFLGRVPEARFYMAQCDAYLSCARSEPFGLALIEALSVGTAIMATDVPSGPREIISPDQTPVRYPFRGRFGVLLPPPESDRIQNAFAFEAGMSELLHQPYPKNQLFSRAADFSNLAQYEAINSLLIKLAL